MPPRAAPASRRLNDYDIVCVHVEASDEASHEGRADAKVEALERIDREIVAQLRPALRPTAGRILVCPTTRPSSGPRPTTEPGSPGRWLVRAWPARDSPITSPPLRSRRPVIEQGYRLMDGSFHSW